MESLVTINITKLVGIPAALLAGTQQVYALGQVGTRALGRSSLITAAGDFDLTGQSEPWTVDVEAEATEAIPVVIQLWDDRGDDAPVPLTRIETTVDPPWLQGTRTEGTNTQVEFQVITRRVPPARAGARVPANRAGQRAQATLRARPAVVLEFSEIRGLYQPGFVPPGVTNPKRSEPCPGYRSEDHLGRAFLNMDLAGNYQRDVQCIEVTVDVVPRRGALPPDTKIRWTLLDPDDQFDNDPEVHRQWAPYIDGNDYPGAAPGGANPNDNEGTPDQNPRWEEAGGHTLTVISDTEAETEITNDQSKVVIHCPNVAGDNLVVRATIEPAAGVEVFDAQTGIITMFHRIDVEYRKMASALDIPVADIPPYFEQARAELNFHQEADLADQDPLATSDNGLSTQAGAYLNANFTHANDAGWFLLLAAMMPYPLPPGGGGNQLYAGNVTLQRVNNYEYFDIPGTHPTADYMRLRFGTTTVGFGVRSAVPFDDSGTPKTRIRIQPHDIQPDFTAGDGSLAHAYATRLYFYPRGRYDGTNFTAPGYGMPNTVHATITEPGDFYTSGISPTENTAAGRFFAGRTIVFTHHGAYRNRTTGLPHGSYTAKVVQTLAHEFVHAFGMPHKCGYFDYRTPRQQTCHLNYSNVWMLNAARQPTPGTSGQIGPNMCGRHLKEVRRVHLEDNGGLRALGW
ncbi:MAG: hypothetical protein AAF799_06245 [Myxococcota bacterium]